MKALIVTIIVVAVVGLLVLTNPDMDDYSDYLRGEMTREAEQEDEFAGALVSIFGGVAESILASATTRDNYVLCSVYTTGRGEDELVVLGVLGNFVVLEGNG